MTERELESWMKARVEKAGGLFLKFEPTSRRGIPDRIAIWPGNTVDFIELKTEKGKLRPEQERFLHKLDVEYGCNVYVLYGIEDIEQYLATIQA